MDGMHDLGGREGFGRIRYAYGEPIYRFQWEARAHALASLARQLKLFNIDEYRHAIERMEPRHYLSAYYYERVLTSCASLCVEKGIFTAKQLEALAGGQFPLALPIGPGRVNRPDTKEFEIGQRITVKNEYVAGHFRLPGYVRGKSGTIVGKSPPVPFPDAQAHGLHGLEEPTYDVRFDTQDLWPDAADKAFVHVTVFQSYIEADAGRST